MENNTVTLNGKKFDISNREECQACLQEVKDIRENLEDGIFYTWLGAIYDNLKKFLEEMLVAFPDEPEETDKSEDTEEPEEEGFDWSVVDWEDPANRIADDYLTETFGDKYDELSGEDQYRKLKTVASVLRWYIDKYEK